MRRVSLFVASVLAAGVVSTAAAVPASASTPIQVDAARACAEQGTPGVATVYPRGILCGGWGWSAGYKTGGVNGQVQGSANPWRYCWDHYRRGASFQWWAPRWVCN